jgi:hypothetical protein
VKTRIWIALSVYLIIAILHKQLNLPGTLYRTIQVKTRKNGGGIVYYYRKGLLRAIR